MNAELRIELLVPSEWSRVEAVRQATDLAVRSVSRFAPEELATSLSIVAGELMENAVKYGRADRAVAFAMRREPDRVVVMVTNVVDDANASAERLKRRVDWLSSFESPRAAFLASIEGLDAETGSGLGLARIMNEGECHLSCAIDANGFVTVEASRAWTEVGAGGHASSAVLGDGESAVEEP